MSFRENYSLSSGTADGGAAREALGQFFAAKYPLRILIAEDNLINQRVLLALLQRLGYQAEHVENGVECVAKVLRESYDLVLSDIDMPYMDGIECTRRLRKMGIDIPIVAVTASFLQHSREECLAAGMNDYVTKPVTLTALERILSEASNSSSGSVKKPGIEA